MIWLGVTLCIIASMLFSGLESAILAVSEVRIRHQAKERIESAKALLAMFEQRGLVLASVLLLNSLFNLLAFAVMTAYMVELAGWWGYLIAFLVALPVYVFLIELLPKAVFKQFPYRALIRFLPLLNAARVVTSPVIWLGAQLVGIFRGREESRQPQLGDETGDPEAQRQEFHAIAATTELGETESKMIRSVLDFHRRRVRHVMLPMASVTAVPANMPIPKALQIARRTNLSHFPVMDETGKLIGLLNIYEVLREGRLHGPVYSLIRRLVRVSTEDSGTAAIRTLRAAGLKIAAVHDKNKKTVGIVTLHDLVNELVQSSAVEK